MKASEHKYRAYDKVKKKWIIPSFYGNICVGDGAVVIIHYKPLHGMYVVDKIQQLTWKEIDNLEIMQYVGFKDFNEKDIYEGDYILYQNIIFEVVYIPTKACFSLKGTNQFTDILATVHEGSFVELYSKDFKIVGNKFDNPELLNVYKDIYPD